MNTNKYEIHEAIARNATLSFHEPGSNGEDVVVRRTCAEIILAGIEYEKLIFKERGYPEDGERQSANSMILDYMAVNWAQINPEPDVESTQQCCDGCNKPSTKEAPLHGNNIDWTLD